MIGIDLSMKHIHICINEKNYTIVFRISLIKGIYDVKVYGESRGDVIEIKNVYPPLLEIIKEYKRIYIPKWFKQIIGRLR